MTGARSVVSSDAGSREASVASSSSRRSSAAESPLASRSNARLVRTGVVALVAVVSTAVVAKMQAGGMPSTAVILTMLAATGWAAQLGAILPIDVGVAGSRLGLGALVTSRVTGRSERLELPWSALASLRYFPRTLRNWPAQIELGLRSRLGGAPLTVTVFAERWLDATFARVPGEPLRVLKEALRADDEAEPGRAAAAMAALRLWCIQERLLWATLAATATSGLTGLALIARGETVVAAVGAAVVSLALVTLLWRRTASIGLLVEPPARDASGWVTRERVAGLVSPDLATGDIDRMRLHPAPLLSLLLWPVLSEDEVVWRWAPVETSGDGPYRSGSAERRRVRRGRPSFVIASRRVDDAAARAVVFPE